MAYALGEIVLIIVGIMIALEANEWKQERRDRAEETRILVRLKEEFEENQKLLAQAERRTLDNIDSMLGFLALFDPQPEAHPDELVHRHVAVLYYVPNYIPNSEVIDSLSASGKISLIENEKLGNQLGAWPRHLEKYKEWIDYIIDEYLVTWDYVVDYHQLRDSRIGRGERPENKGPSRFAYSQSDLLSNPKIESLVESKRVETETALNHLTSIQQVQQSILDLIDAELKER